MNEDEKLAPIERLAEHLCARRPCGDTPENVADWLDYSLNRCGLVVMPEQALATRTPSPSSDIEELVEDLRCEVISLGATAQFAKARKAMRKAADTILALNAPLERMRAAMRRYLPPDSGISAEQFAGEIIGLLDAKADSRS